MVEAVQRSAKQTKWVEQVCAQIAQDCLHATIQEEEEDEGGYKDIVEQTEVVTESSRDDHDQEYPVRGDHTFLHYTSSFEETRMSEEMQANLIKSLAWRLALRSVLEEEERERARKEFVHDDESEAEGVLDLFQGERPHSEEARLLYSVKMKMCHCLKHGKVLHHFYSNVHTTASLIGCKWKVFITV
ncbi:unnamed protein product [Linum trigynum]|uniref:Uncharacterized protein n=1 Tax=Linum trigynum TaxID=586398 RepID=A0AAV2GP08_9ROSI